MNYWIDLFTGETWAEFTAAGATVSGFREKQQSRASKIRVGDVLLCYVKGISRWVGALQVASEMFRDESPVWKQAIFPVRFKVNPLVRLDLETAVDIHDLLPSLSWDARTWSGHVRGSPARIAKDDGDAILKALQEAKANPIRKPFDKRKLSSVPKYAFAVKSRRGKPASEILVTVPDMEEEEQAKENKGDHTRIQKVLLELGAKMGLTLWVAQNDKGRFSGSTGSIAGKMLDKLPTQFDDATTKTIEMIDVLWLKGNSIVAAFEVEHKTSIYSGLLRMSDLLAMQPNLDIRFYLVAPDERRDKVLKQIARPTFSVLKKPLHSVCRYLPYSLLDEAAQKYEAIVQHLKPEFLEDISEDCSPED